MVPNMGRIDLIGAGNRANVESGSIEKRLKNSGDDA